MIDINISKVCKSFGFDLVLNNIDITIQKGEKVGLIGTNGSGKSTILKIIAGQESIDSGSLSIRNNISIGYLSQIPEEKDIIVKDYINGAFKEIIELKEKLERFLVPVRHLDIEGAPHAFLTNNIFHQYRDLTIEFLKGSDTFE